jgi:hypothetical protein
MGVIYQHANAPRPRLEPALAAIQPLCDRLMAVDAAARFQSAASVIDAVRLLRDPAARSVRLQSQ